MDGFISFQIAHQQRRLLHDSGLLRSLPARAKVLCVECGLGDQAAFVARLLPKATIWGVDRSPQAIALARQLHPPEARSNLDFALAGPGSMFLSDCVDLMISNSPLSTFSHFDETITPMVSRLKAGGKIWLTSPSIGSAERIVSGLRHLIRQSEWADYFRGLGKPAPLAAPHEVTTWLRAAGLQKGYVFVTDQQLRFPGLNAFVHWITCKWSAYFLRLPRDRHRLFLDRLVDIASPKNTDFYCIDLAWLSAYAVKPTGRTEKCPAQL